MPRKKVIAGAAGGLTISAVVGYFGKVSLEVAQAALELATTAVRERVAKAAQLSKSHNKPVAAASAGTATDAPAAPRKKPGPPKGTPRKRANGSGESVPATLPAQTAERAEAVEDLPLSGAVDVD